MKVGRVTSPPPPPPSGGPPGWTDDCVLDAAGSPAASSHAAGAPRGSLVYTLYTAATNSNTFLPTVLEEVGGIVLHTVLGQH